jgi:hypothetical protein
VNGPMLRHRAGSVARDFYFFVDARLRPPFFAAARFAPEFFALLFFLALLRLRGTLAPFSRASDSPIAIACSRLFTFG